jgi:hypothetical protein
VFTLLYNALGNKPTGWSHFIFGNRGLGVSFAPKKKRGAVVTTWNRSYTTAAGFGPCSTITELKLAYGNQLKPSKFNTQHGFVCGTATVLPRLGGSVERGN